MGGPHPDREIINESKYPHIVAIAVAGEGLDIGLSRRIMDFHKTRHVQPRHGRSAIPKGGRRSLLSLVLFRFGNGPILRQ